MPEPDYPYPPGYYLALCEHAAEPAFESAFEQETYWGGPWGAADEVGPLRSVLMRRLRDEWRVVRADCFDERAQALMDPAGRWYWADRALPDIERAKAEQQGLIDALTAEGVTVHLVDGYDEAHIRGIYTRDPLVTVPGGAIIGRLAPTMRKGEERHILRALGALGMPILRTIHGTGMVEGGSFAKLTPTVAAYSTSIRCNEEGARQLAESLAWLGIELIIVPMGGWSIHLDGHFAMVGPELALIDPLGLPWWFEGRLHELGIETLVCPPGEDWAINSLCVRPGRVIMNDSCPRARELLESRGIEVVAIPYDEVQKGGGGIHCSTMELRREPA
jgi:N-dimethylarginine dimethylaminohydrolase